MTLLQLCRMGWPEIRDLYHDGKLTPAHLWTAAEGAEKYRKAVASGDIAAPETQMIRAMECAKCPSRVTLTAAMEGTLKHYCGPPFEDRTGSALPSCGCLLGLTINGAPVPGGKLAVASEACPQGKWRACP